MFKKEIRKETVFGKEFENEYWIEQTDKEEKLVLYFDKEKNDFTVLTQTEFGMQSFDWENFSLEQLEEIKEVVKTQIVETDKKAYVDKPFFSYNEMSVDIGLENERNDTYAPHALELNYAPRENSFTLRHFDNDENEYYGPTMTLETLDMVIDSVKRMPEQLKEMKDKIFELKEEAPNILKEMDQKIIEYIDENPNLSKKTKDDILKAIKNNEHSHVPLYDLNQSRTSTLEGMEKIRNFEINLINLEDEHHLGFISEWYKEYNKFEKEGLIKESEEKELTNVQNYKGNFATKEEIDDLTNTKEYEGNFASEKEIEELTNIPDRDDEEVYSR